MDDIEFILDGRDVILPGLPNDVPALPKVTVLAKKPIPVLGSRAKLLAKSRPNEDHGRAMKLFCLKKDYLESRYLPDGAGAVISDDDVLTITHGDLKLVLPEYSVVQELADHAMEQWGAYLGDRSYRARPSLADIERLREETRKHEERERAAREEEQAERQKLREQNRETGLRIITPLPAEFVEVPMDSDLRGLLETKRKPKPKKKEKEDKKQGKGKRK